MNKPNKFLFCFFSFLTVIVLNSDVSGDVLSGNRRIGLKEKLLNGDSGIRRSAIAPSESRISRTRVHVLSAAQRKQNKQNKQHPCKKPFFLFFFLKKSFFLFRTTSTNFRGKTSRTTLETINVVFWLFLQHAKQTSNKREASKQNHNNKTDSQNICILSFKSKTRPSQEKKYWMWKLKYGVEFWRAWFVFYLMNWRTVFDYQACKSTGWCKCKCWNQLTLFCAKKCGFFF